MEKETSFVRRLHSIDSQRKFRSDSLVSGDYLTFRKKYSRVVKTATEALRSVRKSIQEPLIPTLDTPVEVLRVTKILT